MLTRQELITQKQLLEALARKCKTDALYLNTREGIKVIDRELENEANTSIVLKDAIEEDGGLHSRGWYVCYTPNVNSNTACLDGDFTAEDLEAIARWMNAHNNSDRTEQTKE